MFGNNYASSEFILSKVREVTDNVTLIKYIENGIKNVGGYLRINEVKSGKCDFEFKNQDVDYNINIDNDKIRVDNNILNLREEVIYDKSQDGIQIEFYGNYRVLDDSGLVMLKNIEEKSYYDSNKKFISSNAHIEKTSLKDGNVVKKIMGTNCDIDVKQCVVGDEIVKIEDVRYHCMPDMIFKKCYVSEYRNGMYCSVNEDVYTKPLYFEILGDFSNYECKIKSIEEKNAQNQKTML